MVSWVGYVCVAALGSDETEPSRACFISLDTSQDGAVGDAAREKRLRWFDTSLSALAGIDCSLKLAREMNWVKVL